MLFSHVSVSHLQLPSMSPVSFPAWALTYHECTGNTTRAVQDNGGPRVSLAQEPDQAARGLKCYGLWWPMDFHWFSLILIGSNLQQLATNGTRCITVHHGAPCASAGSCLHHTQMTGLFASPTISTSGPTMASAGNWQTKAMAGGQCQAMSGHVKCTTFSTQTTDSLSLTLREKDFTSTSLSLRALCETISGH